MPLSLAASNFSHAWARDVAQVALYQSVTVGGTLTEVDGSILDELLVPIYERRAVALDRETDGARSAQFPVRFGIPPGTTVRWYGLLDVYGNLLSLEPLSVSVTSNTPQPCLFKDLITGWIEAPTRGAVGDTVVFWSTPSLESARFPTGSYSTLPSPIYDAGPYTIWYTESVIGVGERFTIKASASVEADRVIPTNYGWGYYQRIDPVTYPIKGTLSLDGLRVRTTG